MHDAVETKVATYLIQTQCARGQLNSRETTRDIMLNPWTGEEQWLRVESRDPQLKTNLARVNPAEYGKVSTSLQISHVVHEPQNW